MNARKRLVFTMLVLMTGLLTSQCFLPERVVRRGGNYHVTLDPRWDGAVIQVGETLPVSTGIIDFLEDVDSERTNNMRFYVDGLVIDESTVTLGSGYYFGPTTFDWIPVAPGEYFLQVSGTRRGNLAISRAIRVCVIDFSLQSPDLETEPGAYIYTTGYTGECEIPERSGDARPGPLTFTARVMPEALTYYPGWWNVGYYEHRSNSDGQELIPEGCDNQPDSLQFTATAGDPNDDIAFAKVDVTYEYHSSVRSSILILNRSGGSSLDSKTFSGTSYFGPYRASTMNETFEVRWTAYGIGRSGEILAQDGPNTIPVEPCIFEEMVPLDAQLPELLPAEPLPFEPSEATCPPGTYYAPVTNRCIEIQIPSSGGSDKDGEGGGCNKSVASCSAQGLSFDSNNCTCVPIQ